MKDTLVVLIHGLGGKAEDHFGFLMNVVASEAEYFERAEFDFFSYPSRKASLFTFPRKKRYPNLDEIGAAFATYLKHRVQEYERIVIVGYSNGGLIAKVGLLACQDSYVMARVAKLTFIATPHRGSDVANVGQFLAIASEISADLTSGSAYLMNLDDRWVASQMDRIPALYLYGVRDNVVSYHSALSNDPSRCVVAPKADHSTITHFHAEDICYQRLRDWIITDHAYEFATPFGDTLSHRFSSPVVATMLDLGCKIDKLTSEQYKSFEEMAKSPRLAINGCAGSGKTLVAAEKAIRLADAGYSVGIFCHSPILSQRIADLVAKSPRVSVYYFYDYIYFLLNRARPHAAAAWDEFEEPTSDEIYEALAALDSPDAIRFDAVIVDEGQDFKDDWLDLVQAALINGSSGLYYVFYDEMQGLSLKGQLPKLPKASISLVRNCRNAGNIFAYVKKFYPRPSELYPELDGKGDFQFFFHPLGDMHAAREAIAHALEKVPPNNLVVLTNEIGGVGQSLLNGLVVHRLRKHSWQAGMTDFLAWLRKEAHRLLREENSEAAEAVKAIDIPTFGSGSYPSAEDLEKVRAASKYLRRYISAIPISRSYEVCWRAVGSKLVPRKKVANLASRRDSLLLRADYSAEGMQIGEAIEFISHDNWVNSMPEPQRYIVKPYYERRENTIPLYEISHFKGCEAEGVVLFVHTPRDGLDRFVYTGLSRARSCLHLVCRPEPFSRLPQFERPVAAAFKATVTSVGS
ncbi:hypothetical protein [Azospirillum sp.]|uniref:alpha/beta hydrolase n=1 Tax=Azospirillum sp. TaxID=34012 RepID=UPI002D29216B|nr:hypothetical protein [Azospirillum sp.]HYD65803.1 hypothetical protein [Azospirillum sp.]